MRVIMSKMLEIFSCLECPNCLYRDYRDYYYYCDLMPYKVITDPYNNIPDWSPLSDYKKGDL